MGELIGTSEMAELLGISRVRAQQLQAKPGFPEPLAVLAAGKIYDRDQVLAWADERERLAPLSPWPALPRPRPKT